MANDLPKRKLILCLDFDGVIHSYSSGWKGPRVIPDPPVAGAMTFLMDAVEYFHVMIYSSRTQYWGGKRAMKIWLINCIDVHLASIFPDLKGMENPFTHDELATTRMAKDFVANLKFPSKKPPAFLQIDDRAIQFTGVFPDPEGLLSFKPWNKK